MSHAQRAAVRSALARLRVPPAGMAVTAAALVAASMLAVVAAPSPAAAAGAVTATVLAVAAVMAVASHLREPAVEELCLPGTGVCLPA